MEILVGPEEEKPDYAQIAWKVGRRAENRALAREERPSGPCCCKSGLDVAGEAGVEERGLYRFHIRSGTAWEYYRDGDQPGTDQPFYPFNHCYFEPKDPFAARRNFGGSGEAGTP